MSQTILHGLRMHLESLESRSVDDIESCTGLNNKIDQSALVLLRVEAKEAVCKLDLRNARLLLFLPIRTRLQVLLSIRYLRGHDEQLE